MKWVSICSLQWPEISGFVSWNWWYKNLEILTKVYLFIFIFLFFGLFVFFCCCCYCCYFLGRSRGIWRFPGQGLNRSCSHQPTPEPQQLGIRAASATVHGNAGSLTHWARAGTEPATSWFLVGFVNHCAMTGTPSFPFYGQTWNMEVPGPGVRLSCSHSNTGS